ncbi:PDZ domain-containing protein 4 isoform X2 [Cylas formicarius]|uniref:PDZ domain-containing protein 4 isoform X2 n=1 Tax=Cylas formicarius TaxID=197179 RepID=UPI0029589123|nr:PDZ domain-containing protein 4 isoform X2 [Cylas formicarius]
MTVNGTDVSSFPHEDAVRAFLTAHEPIVVEVKRRISDSPSPNRSAKYVSSSCQTDICGVQWIEENSLDCLPHDIDLEEVTLRKCSSDEKLGLTVCYSSGSEVDTCTEVYIRDIAPQSVADRDGRLRQGDQILQVNGKDVANKEETESLFAENRKAVTLLVSRCYNRSEEYLDTEPVDAISPNGRHAAYQNSIIEQLVQQQSEHSSKNDAVPKIPNHLVPDKLNLTNSLVRSKIDSINQEISQLDYRMQNIHLVKSDKRKPPQFPHIPAPPESDTEHIYETIPEDSLIDGEIEPIYSCPYEPSEENMIEQWLKVHQEDVWVAATQKESLNEEEEIIRDGKESKKSKSKGAKSNSSGEEHENSSSAYNTGGSSNSNPLTFELAATQDAKQKNVYRSTLILCPLEEKDDLAKEKETKTTCESCKRQASKTKKSKSSVKITSPSSPTVHKPGLSPAHILSDTMYTNVANLQQTMLLQQQLFRQALVHQNPEFSTKPTTSFTAPSLTQYQFVTGSHVVSESAMVESKMEWKVKRRPDGTRYIARRPVRNRILKNREIKLSEERAGLTTEDDTISELKIGRYWTKEERKKHLEKSRERKQRQEILLASRNIEEVTEDTMKHLDKTSSRKTANNIDNTVKKHKTKGRTHKEGYDNFSTVQEVIVHGPKVPNSNSKMMGLLSVTTV